nr:probable sugar phosphate/phosphate translocator At5g25400 [Ipomoea batatas]
MGSGGDLSDGVLKKIVLSYTYVTIWIFLSFTVIIYNKYILDRKMYNWPYPISLTMIHMAFCSSFAYFLVRVLKLVDPVSICSRPSCPSLSTPLVFSAAKSLLGLTPCSIWSPSPLGSPLPLMGRPSITLNPITSLYYVAPCCLAFLFVPWVMVEYPNLKENSSYHFDYMIFGTNSFCAFALNLAVFLLVGKTSALTMNVAGVVKDWMLIAFSWSVIKDTVTPINLVGYGLAFLGVAYYNHMKLQTLRAKEAQKKSAENDDGESGKLGGLGIEI